MGHITPFPRISEFFSVSFLAPKVLSGCHQSLCPLGGPVLCSLLSPYLSSGEDQMFLVSPAERNFAVSIVNIIYSVRFP